MPRPSIAISVLILALSLVGCSKLPPSEPTSESSKIKARNRVLERTVSEVREIDGILGFALFHEKNQASSLGVGEFYRITADKFSAEKFTGEFPFYYVIGKDGLTVGYGRMKMKWCPIPLPKPWGSFHIKTNIRMVWIFHAMEMPLPDPLMSPRFTAIFPVSQITDAERKRTVSEASGIFVFYEIPPAWSRDAVALLSGKEPTTIAFENASPLGKVLCFLRELRAAESDPTLASVPRQHLIDLIERKADPQLIESFFYLAIHPATRHPRSEAYWEMFLEAFKNGSIPKSSGARLERAFTIFAGLPRAKAVELYELLRHTGLKESDYYKNFSDLTAEDQRFMAAQFGMCFYMIPFQQAPIPWPTNP